MSNYIELLKDPRWQKKRLEIFERDKWECQCCFKGDRTLHVHHKEYNYGILPWEYDAELLITLCEFCHSVEEKFKKVKDPFIEAFTHDGKEWLRFKFFEEINLLRFIREVDRDRYEKIMAFAQEQASDLGSIVKNSLPVMNRIV